MQSFRTEYESDGVVSKDILELAQKIQLFKSGKMDEESFRSLRLARGVYGQRQHGVQMIRMKIPYGQVQSHQLRRIAEVSDKYSTGNLHITTRQDIQIHYVDLEVTPQLWEELEKDSVTLREACGNTVRNVTASELSGIDPEEVFDVFPYADAVFRYFLRNPICQEMGRKFKVSFSNSDRDTGLSYMHDLGFIAREKEGKKGFKIMLGGGLGSQPRHADCLYEFLETDRIIPLMEAILRVFDRYGERKSRAKARLKFLINNLGLEAFKDLVEQERLALPSERVSIPTEGYQPEINQNSLSSPREDKVSDEYKRWYETNVLVQKQEGYKAIGIKVKLGNFTTEQARQLADLVDNLGLGELRFTLRQNIVLPYIKEENVYEVWQRLSELGLAEVGYNKLVDITACPGTDTCNLGISSSTGIAEELERIIKAEYSDLVVDTDLVIKISGCMNACGQHNMANIGYQGMSLKSSDGRVAPALQVLLGGGNLGGGKGVFADKVLKIPSKRGPESLRRILDDYKQNGGSKDFVEYYADRGKIYFYDLLKDLSESDDLKDNDFIDWGAEEAYRKSIGIGECAGVVVDLVGSLLLDTREKLEKAEKNLSEKKYSHGIYYAYSAMIGAAKALLLSQDISTNSQAQIVEAFDEQFVDSGHLDLPTSFNDLVYQINQHKPTVEFAHQYVSTAKNFQQLIETYNSVPAL